ncbi:hypothetical protein [Methylophilus luteus]|uniref:Uncharacterized protein n=1 Tax=Methylophilus luteus TaxID=640108 RepID=A0ABW3FCC3_9PROT
MKNFSTVEDAYSEIGNSCIDFVTGRTWDAAICKFQIYNKMAIGRWSLKSNGIETNEALNWPDSSIDGGGAALFLRDDLLATTGDRIWGLTFTLFPDGKIKIEYDYNKPAEYEDTDEVITGEEMNQSLTDLL